MQQAPATTNHVNKEMHTMNIEDTCTYKELPAPTGVYMTPWDSDMKEAEACLLEATFYKKEAADTCNDPQACSTYNDLASYYLDVAMCYMHRASTYEQVPCMFEGGPATCMHPSCMIEQV